MKRFSENLKRVRESKGISIQDISKETRINAKFLEAIENGNYKILPQTYVRAFIRAYAKHLGLNPNEVLDHYNLELSGKAPSEPAIKNQTPTYQVTPSQIEQPEIPTRQIQQEIPPQLETELPKNKDKSDEKSEKSNEDSFIETQDSTVADLKTKETEEKDEKHYEFKENPESKGKSAKIKINIPVLLVLFVLIITVGVIAIFYFPIQSKKSQEVKEQPFENVLKETIEKYNPKPLSDTVLHNQPDSILSIERFSSDSLTLSLLSENDLWVNVQIDNSRSERGKLIPNQKKNMRAKERFVVTASRGKNIKVFLNSRYLGNLSNSDSLRSIYVTPEGIKTRKIERKPEIKKQDELKPLEYKPIG